MTLDPSQYHFKEYIGEHFRPVNQFYKKQKHKGSASGDERVFIIEHDNDIVAAVRLVPFDDYYWLRSLYVEKTRQGQSLGSQLLAYVHEHIHHTIFCFPYLHLDHFYQQAEYVLVTPDNLPQNLEQLYQRYNRKGRGILAMAKYPPA